MNEEFDRSPTGFRVLSLPDGFDGRLPPEFGIRLQIAPRLDVDPHGSGTGAPMLWPIHPPRKGGCSPNRCVLVLERTNRRMFPI